MRWAVTEKGASGGPSFKKKNDKTIAAENSTPYIYK